MAMLIATSFKLRLDRKSSTRIYSSSNESLALKINVVFINYYDNQYSIQVVFNLQSRSTDSLSSQWVYNLV